MTCFLIIGCQRLGDTSQFGWKDRFRRRWKSRKWNRKSENSSSISFLRVNKTQNYKKKLPWDGIAYCPSLTSQFRSMEATCSLQTDQDLARLLFCLKMHATVFWISLSPIWRHRISIYNADCSTHDIFLNFTLPDFQAKNFTL